MKKVKVDGIPKRIRTRCTKKEILARLDELMRENAKYQKILFTFDEYSSVLTAKASLNTSAKRYNYPLKFYNRCDVLYVERTDM